MKAEHPLPEIMACDCTRRIWQCQGSRSRLQTAGLKPRQRTRERECIRKGLPACFTASSRNLVSRWQGALALLSILLLAMKSFPKPTMPGHKKASQSSLTLCGVRRACHPTGWQAGWGERRQKLHLPITSKLSLWPTSAMSMTAPLPFALMQAIKRSTTSTTCDWYRPVGMARCGVFCCDWHITQTPEGGGFIKT